MRWLALLSVLVLAGCADGYVQVQCAVQDGVSTYSFQVTWPPGSIGADEGRCVIVYDLDDPSEGTFAFALTADDLPVAVYEDATSPLDGTQLDFLPSECL
jgi:hypothetical protein